MGEVPEQSASPREAARRVAWFHDYAARLEGQPPRPLLPCPCCGCRTLDDRGGYEICPVCFWEDDGQDDHDADTVRGGPNGPLSLSQARVNYRRFGALDERSVVSVRPPRPEELP